MIERRFDKAATIEVKEAGDNGAVKVRAASFLSIDRKREMIMPGAYARHLERYAARGRVFIDHKHSAAAKVANMADAYEDRTGLISVAKFHGTPIGQETRRMAKEGELRDVSIGHQVLRDRFATPTEVKKIWSAHGYTPSRYDLLMLNKPGPVRVIDEAEPVEFSFVGIPMNENAETLEVKSAAGIEIKKGAVLNGANAKALKQAYKLIRSIFKSARIEDLEDADGEAPAASEMKSADVETPASTPTETKPPETETKDTELLAKRLRVELDLMSMDLEPEADRAPTRGTEEIDTEARIECPVTQV